MEDIGLVGLPFSGKSTLFTALTRSGSHGGQANAAVVEVPDPRLPVLTEMERSAKTVHAQVRFVDVPGGVSSAQGVAMLREVDALAVVVRCFGPDAAPTSELANVRAELLLADLTVIAACYGALDLITFLTTGEDESRAWAVRRGAKAPEAAGVIHTDLERGFIRAEVIAYDDLVAAGSMEAAKAAGKIRVEGKDYAVQEGDVLHVRFAV